MLYPVIFSDFASVRTFRFAWSKQCQSKRVSASPHPAFRHSHTLPSYNLLAGNLISSIVEVCKKEGHQVLRSLNKKAKINPRKMREQQLEPWLCYAYRAFLRDVTEAMFNWCSTTMKQRPCWCSKPILWELNSFLM